MKIMKCTACLEGVCRASVIGNPASPACCCSCDGFSKHVNEGDPMDTRKVGFQKAFNKILKQKFIRIVKLLRVWKECCVNVR